MRIRARSQDMKIICLASYRGQIELSIKPETALLVNNKPFFIPHFTSDVRSLPCVALRICRLGRNIDQRFAARYYDAVAAALDFSAYDCMSAARERGESLSAYNAFDNSFAISKWTDKQEEDSMHLNISVNGNTNTFGAMIISPMEAIALVSRYFKLCTGDIIAISIDAERQKLDINDKIEVANNSEVLISMNIK